MFPSLSQLEAKELTLLQTKTGVSDLPGTSSNLYKPSSSNSLREATVKESQGSLSSKSTPPEMVKFVVEGL